MRPPVAFVLATACAVPCVTTARRARADEPIPLTVTGSAAPGFTVKTREGDRPRDVPDAAALLEGLPGLRVRRLGGDGSFATLSIRGAASNQVAVVLGGVPLTGGADPSLDLATLPLWPGAVARVHRTFAPASVGGGYLGGVVELSPVEASTRARTEVYDAIGSFGAYRVRLADTRPVGRFQVATGLAYHRSDGDFRFFDPYRNEDVVRANAASAQIAGVMHARGELDRWTLLFTALGSVREDGVAGTFDRPLRATQLARDRALGAVEARRSDDEGRWLMRAWIRRDGRRFDDPLAEQSIAGGSARDRVLAFGGSVARSLRVGEALTFDARVDPSLESSRGARLEGPSPDRDRLSLGVALDATWRASGALSVVLAARADTRTDGGAGAETRREILPVAHLGVEHRLHDVVTLAAHAGTLARPPSFLELLGDGALYSAAPDLRSERAWAADLGVRARGGKLLRWEIEAIAFAWQVRDLIVVAPVGIRTFRAQNVGAARILGGEVSVAASAGPLRALVSYTRLSTEDRTSSVVSRGAPLPGRPDHDLTLDVSVGVGPVRLRYGLDVVSATTLDRAGTRELPTRVFHGAGARLELGKVTVLVEVANLFDQRTVTVPFESGRAPRFGAYPISDFLGYPLAGRRFTLALRATL